MLQMFSQMQLILNKNSCFMDQKAFAEELTPDFLPKTSHLVVLCLFCPNFGVTICTILTTFEAKWSRFLLILSP